MTRATTCWPQSTPTRHSCSLPCGRVVVTVTPSAEESSSGASSKDVPPGWSSASPGSGMSKLTVSGGSGSDRGSLTPASSTTLTAIGIGSVTLLEPRLTSICRVAAVRQGGRSVESAAVWPMLTAVPSTDCGMP